MTLDQQIQVLIQEAPQYGVAPVVIEKAIAPVLQSIAQQLKHSSYYILQNSQEQWLISVIKKTNSSSKEKKVVYAFTTVQDAKNFNQNQQADLIATPLPIVQILFRLFSLTQIESMVFFEEIGNTTKGSQVKRQDIQNSIQQKLIQLKTTPSDIA